MTLFCPETKQVLDKRTLDDKEGERVAVTEMLTSVGSSLKHGIASGDAGILSPEVTEKIVGAGHGYVLQIKGNAGHAFTEAVELPWSKVTAFYEDINVAHGREDMRKVKAISGDFVEFDELEKYKNIDVVLQVERISREIKSGKVSYETSYYIGDEAFASLEIATMAQYVRDHWAQESYHWVKDVVLKEDDSFQRRANGSRLLSVIRSLVIKTGTALHGSTQTFIDHFVADPRTVAQTMFFQ